MTITAEQAQKTIEALEQRIEDLEKNRSRSDRIAYLVTAAMATWTFIMVFLLACLLEIVWNHTPWAAAHHLAFDPSTIILNLFLSLIAAVQGSVIMIAQKQSDKTRDLQLAQMRAEIQFMFGWMQESHGVTHERLEGIEKKQKATRRSPMKRGYRGGRL